MGHKGGMCDLRVMDAWRALGRPSLSLEFFPPKDLTGFGVLGGSIERMKCVAPDFVSCTYGAGGSRQEFSFAAWELLQRMGFKPVVAHLTCVGASAGRLRETVDRIHAAGIRNIMALRGDPPRGEASFRPAADGLAHAADLVRLVKETHPDICVGVAGYPETHPESASAEEDIRHLREKVEAGADFVTTQLFYDNTAYFSFVEACRAAGIPETVPIFPGLMPVSSPVQLERSVAFSRASVPPALAEGLSRTDEAAAFGMSWLIAQMDGLVRGGAPGIHLYILNQAKTVLDPRLRQAVARWR